MKSEIVFEHPPGDRRRILAVPVIAESEVSSVATASAARAYALTAVLSEGGGLALPWLATLVSASRALGAALPFTIRNELERLTVLAETQTVAVLLEGESVTGGHGGGGGAGGDAQASRGVRSRRSSEKKTAVAPADVYRVGEPPATVELSR